jgi:hypothetical protein
MFSGGFGTWRHNTVRESRTGAGRPRVDVVKSTVWLDLRSEPWWVAVGEVPSDVIFSARWVDLWGFLLGADGVTEHANGPRAVLASAPVPVYRVPSEIDGIVRGESGFVALHTEVRWRDPYAVPGVQPARPEIVLEPASALLGWPTAKPGPDLQWWPWHAGAEITDEFWSCANFAITLITADLQDRPVLDRLAQIGVAGGGSWDPSMFPDEVADAIRAGMDEALSDLMEAAHNPNTARLRHVDRAEMDRDYFGRALRSIRPTREINSC